MSTEVPQGDPWRWPSILLWSLFFLFGLWPEATYYALRAAGYVFSQNAIINSYHFITWSLAGYMVHFVYHRGVEAGVAPVEALGKGVQLGVIAFVAFIDIPLEQLALIRQPVILGLVLGTTGLKLAAWLYLYLLLIRYHLRRDPAIVAHTLSWLAGGATTKADDEPDNRDDRTGAQDTPPAASMKEQAD